MAAQALNNQMGREALKGLRFIASLPLAGTGQREGGGFSCINKRIISHPITISIEVVHLTKFVT